MKKVLSAVILSALFVSFATFPASAQKKAGALNRKVKTEAPPTETRFGSVAAYSDGIQGVFLRWETLSEVENIGFQIYRVTGKETTLLSPEKLVAGQAMRGREIPEFGRSYDYFDADGQLDSAYIVEAISISGARYSTSTIYPTYQSDLTSVMRAADGELYNPGRTKFARIEDSLLSPPKELITEMEANQHIADPTTHRQIISQPGVRIGVKRDGVYRVMRSQLEAAGFNVGADPSLWQLYLEGVEQSIIIGGSGDYIEFFGRAADTRETDIRVYYLTVGANAGKRIGTRSARPQGSTVVSPSYNQTFVKKERTNYVEDVINGETENYWGRSVGSTATTMTFTLTGVDFSSPTATLDLRFLGYSPGVHSIEVLLNETLLAPVAGSGPVSYTGSYTVPTSALHEGANSIRFRAIGPTGDFSFFDVMSIGFARTYTADANRISFYTPNLRTAKLGGFTSPNVRVFDLTWDDNPVVVTNLNFQLNGATYAADIPAYRPRTLFAVEDSALLAPDSVTPNNPELVSSPTNGAQLVIISYRDFMPQAQIWAQYRMSQGISVKVIEVSELYDEYNYGSLSSQSIKSFLADTAQNWSIPPQYVLLIGDGSWDSRNYENFGNWNMVPPAIVPTVYMETASDEALADFNNDGLAEIAIGRISARTAIQVTTVYNKTVQFESLPGNPLDRGGIFAYDFNQGYQFDVLSADLRNQIPSMPATFVYRGEANANTNLINAMNTGKLLVNYSGHGTAGSWGGSPLFFNVFSVPSLSDSNPSIYTMLTCLNGYFHWLYNPSLAEVLTNTPNKGAVAAWGSSGKTTADLQQVMGRRFYLKVGEGTIPRLGDLIKDAKTSLTYGSDVRLSWALIGDPMLKVR